MLILASLLIGVVALAAGGSFWQLIKRDQFLKRLLSACESKESLSQVVDIYVAQGLFEKPAEQVSPTGQFYSQDFGSNIMFEIHSSLVANKRIRLICILAIAVAMIVGLLIRPWLALLPMGLFLFGGLVPLGESARLNALKDVEAMAWNLYQMRKRSGQEAEQFVLEHPWLTQLDKAITSRRLGA